MILVTGTSSGLGAHLLGALPAEPLDILRPYPDQADCIIHCAWPPTLPTHSADIGTYLANIEAPIWNAARIPHRKFVFLSSVGVYPASHSGKESDAVTATRAELGFYGDHKLGAEKLVWKVASRILILRVGAMIGTMARPESSWMRILRDYTPTVRLTPESSFYLIRHEQVSDFIKLAIEKDLTGIYNLVPDHQTTLRELAGNKPVTWGSYTYTTPKVCNDKAAEIMPSLRETAVAA